MALCRKCKKNYKMPKENYCPICLVEKLRQEVQVWKEEAERLLGNQTN